MKRSFILLFLFVSLAIYPLSIFAECPGCFKDTHLPRIQNRTINGVSKQVITIKIGDTWKDPNGEINPKILKAAQDAAQMWNDADTDGFQFVVDQNVSDAEVSIKIIKSEPATRGSFASITNNYGVKGPYIPYLVMRVPDFNKNRSAEELKDRFGHEYAHAKGVAHPRINPATGKPECDGTIMGRSNTDGSRDAKYNMVYAADVAAARKFKDSAARLKCTEIPGETDGDGVGGGGSSGSDVIYETVDEAYDPASCQSQYRVTIYYELDHATEQYIPVGTKWELLMPCG